MRRMVSCAFSVFLVGLLVGRPVAGIGNIVNTTSGLVKGVMTTFQQKNVYEFRMVPYAEPPIGDLRFKSPLPKSRDASTIDGTQHDYVVCPQDPVILEYYPSLVPGTRTINESCLFLDVYVPATPTANNLLPVMFWVHGGGYILGAGWFTTGQVLAALHDVIVVTINYRLGALGFLNTGDANSEGDFGLQDQILALQWVNDNIQGFGGDVTKITLAGESAGASSVAQMTIAPRAKGLFKRAIIQSGGLDNPWACSPNTVPKSKAFAVNISCSQNTNKDMVRCLRASSTEEIVRNQGLEWSPACSGVVLPYTIQQLETAAMKSDVANTLAGVDILMGVNSQEGGLFLGQSSIIEDLSKLKGVTEKESPSIAPLVQFLYTDWKMPNDSVALKKKLIDFSGDVLFYPYAIRFKRLHSALKGVTKGRSYFYLLKPRPSWMPQAPWRTGADHADDVYFVFGDPVNFPSINATDEEKVLSRVIMAYWTNFAKTGDPNSPQTTVDSQALVQWPQFDLDTESYLGLDLNMTADSVGQRLFAQRIAFWTDYFPAELDRLRNLKPPEPCIDPTRWSGGTGPKAAIVVIVFSCLALVCLSCCF